MKIQIRPPQRDFPIGCIINMLDHVIWSRDQTKYKYPALSHNFQLLAPAHLPNYSRRNSLTLNFELLFISLLILSILLSFWSERKYSKTIPNFALAKFQLPLIENILRHFQIMSLPNSNCISLKIF